MTNPRSNSRRFVNAAWSLLTFQLIASVGAVGVTGVAAFHVANLVNGAQQAGAPVEPAVEATAPAATEATPATADPAAAAPAAAAQAAPAGPVNMGAGSLTLEQRLNVGIVAVLSDPDGIRGVRRIQWFRNGQLMPNVTRDTYPVRSEDNDAMITARTEYVDGNGNDEIATSQAVQARYIIQ